MTKRTASEYADGRRHYKEKKEATGWERFEPKSSHVWSQNERNAEWSESENDENDEYQEET